METTSSPLRTSLRPSTRTKRGVYPINDITAPLRGLHMARVQHNSTFSETADGAACIMVGGERVGSVNPHSENPSTMGRITGLGGPAAV